MGHRVQMLDGSWVFGPRRVRQRFPKLFQLLELHPRLSVVRNRRIVRALSRFRADIILNTYSDWDPASVAEARSLMGSKTIYLFLYPDATANLGREFPLVADYDAWFFKDPFSVDLFRSRLGINVHYLPEACNPVWHRPVDVTSEDKELYACDLTTAGNMYYYRARILESLMAYDMKIWGSSFPAWLESPLRANYPGKYVACLEKAKAFRAAKIVVNTLSHKEVGGVNARTFETAGSGAFQIADWRPATEILFKADEEIVVFRSLDELKEKVDYYLQRPDERRRIAEAGCRRAHAEHTYRHRLEQALTIAMACR